MQKNSVSLAREWQTVKRMHYLMGTFVEIEASAQRQDRAIDAIEAAFAAIKQTEQALSKYQEKSVVSYLNQNAYYHSVKVAPEIFAFIDASLRYSRLTNGAFDITVNPLIELWHVAQQKGVVPTSQEIEDVVSKVGYRNVILNPKDMTVFFQVPGTKIDFGGIGKGYAIDKAIEVLREHAIENAMVNAGGNIFCLDSENSTIGIKNPLYTDEIITTVRLTNEAISTSALYERFFDIGGRRYVHLISPQTGFPVDNGVLSVSVVAPSAQHADMASTAVFILGVDKGMQLIDGTDNLEGIIIAKDGRRLKVNVSKHLLYS